MRLTKPIDKFTREEVYNICDFVTALEAKYTGKEKVKPEDCTFGFTSCHFSGGKYCRRVDKENNA